MSGVQGAGPPGGGFKGGSAPFASFGSRAVARWGAGQRPAKKILTFNYVDYLKFHCVHRIAHYHTILHTEVVQLSGGLGQPLIVRLLGVR